MSPVDVLRTIMHAAMEVGDMAGARSAASVLAPFVHPKLSAQTIRNSNEAEAAMSDADLDAEIDGLHAKMRAAGMVPPGFRN